MASLGIYKTYSFKDKDPAIDSLRTIIQDQGEKYSSISAKSGVSEGTLHGWFHGKTRRPQHATIVAVARALGWDYRLVRKNGRSSR
jgi:hypothetical protein